MANPYNLNILINRKDVIFLLSFVSVANGPNLSNNNQTVTCVNGESCVKTNTNVTSGKMYLEVNLSVYGIGPYIGIINADTYTSYTGYPPYNNNTNLITTALNQISALGKLSIKIDFSNKTVIISQGTTILVSKTFTFNKVNLIMGSGSSGGSGGNTTFTIINKSDSTIPSSYFYYGTTVLHLLKMGQNYYNIDLSNYDIVNNVYNPLTITTNLKDLITSKDCDITKINSNVNASDGEIFKPINKFIPMFNIIRLR